MKAGWISGWAVLALGGAAAMATPSYTAVFLPEGGYTSTYANGIADNGQIVGYSRDSGDALLWESADSNPVNLNPPGFVNTLGYDNSQANGTDGAVQVGRATISSNGVAVAWQGTAASAIQLAVPSGFSEVGAAATTNGQIVGSGTSPDGTHALLWNSVDATAIDLNPANYSSSGANGTNGTQQVGSGTTTVNGQSSGLRALLWSGTAASAQDITPVGYSDAQAFGISGDLAVGWGSPGTGQQDALLWNISDGTYTDLGPGVAYAVAGNYEVGYTGNDAMLWNGSAASAVNLQNYLPSSYAYSYALGVDANGDVVGYAGAYGQNQAVIWLAPEPNMISIALVGLSLSVRRRRLTA